MDNTGGSELVRWGVEGKPLAIEYSPEAMEAVRAAVVDGFYKLPRGGLEVGGILFGQRDSASVRILASRPLACEHAAGPSFVLSEGDESALRQALESAASDPDLAGMAPVGWYHSHTRSGIFLSDQDQGIYDRYFPEPWQVALVLRPEKMKPTRAGFFFREEGGTVRRDSSYLEFQLEPPVKERKARPQRPEGAARPSVPEPEPAPMIVPRSGGRVSWLLFALAWCVAAASLAYALRDHWLPKPPVRLALHLADAGGQLTVSWDNASPPAREAEGGVLEIVDGGRKFDFPLHADQVRKGNFTYARGSGDVRARLQITLPKGGSVEGLATFAGPPPGGPPAQETQQDREQLTQEIEKLRADLARQEKRNRDLEAAIAALKKRRKKTGP
jgi:proteasome lid subunit RPN8/RPN11